MNQTLVFWTDHQPLHSPLPIRPPPRVALAVLHNVCEDSGVFVVQAHVCEAHVQYAMDTITLLIKL